MQFGVMLKPNKPEPVPRCKHHVTYYVSAGKSGERQKWRICGRPAGTNGWCSEHGYAQEVLDLAARYAWQALDITPERTIGRGYANWFGYAESVSARTWARDRVTVQNAAIRFEQENKAALQRALDRIAAVARGVDVPEAEIEQAIEQAALDAWRGGVPLKRAVAVPAAADVLDDDDALEAALENAVF